MGTYLNTNLNKTTQANPETNSGEGFEGVIATNKTSMPITEGISETSEANNIQGKNFALEIPVLEAPNALEETINKVIKVSEESAKILGVAKDIVMNIADFYKAILDKLDAKFSTIQGLDISKMTAEALDLFCLLLTQSSKEKMIQSFKTLLNEKIKERGEKNDAYVKEVNDVTKKNIEAVEKAKEAEKKAKNLGIFKAVLGAVVAVITTAIAVAVTAISFGSMGPVAMTFAALALTAAIGSCIFTVASSGCTIAALCIEDPELKSKFNKLAMGFGLAAMACGIASAICSGGVSFCSGGINMIGRILNGVSAVISGISQCASGTGDIILGVENIKLADLQRELADKKIDLTKLEETIALLNKLIEMLTNTAENLIKDFLENEQQAAKELINVAQTESELADGITVKGV